MPNYTVTVTDAQEEVVNWVLKERQKYHIEGQEYAGPATVQELIQQRIDEEIKPATTAFTNALDAFLQDELAKASDTDTRADIVARAKARLLAG